MYTRLNQKSYTPRRSLSLKLTAENIIEASPCTLYIAQYQRDSLARGNPNAHGSSVCLAHIYAPHITGKKEKESVAAV